MQQMQTVNTVNLSESVGKLIDTTETVIKKADTSLTNIISIIVTFVVTQSKKILKFLIDRNVVSAGIAIIVGTQISRLTTAFVDNLLGPFINLILPSEKKHLEQYEIEIYGAHFKVGLFISNFIQFLMNMAMVYYVFQIAQFSSGNSNTFLNQTISAGTIASAKK